MQHLKFKIGDIIEISGSEITIPYCIWDINFEKELYLVASLTDRDPKDNYHLEFKDQSFFNLYEGRLTPKDFFKVEERLANIDLINQIISINNELTNG